MTPHCFAQYWHLLCARQQVPLGPRRRLRIETVRSALPRKTNNSPCILKNRIAEARGQFRLKPTPERVLKRV